MEDFRKKIVTGILSKWHVVFERVLALFILRVLTQEKENLVLLCGAFFFRVFLLMGR